MVLVLGEEIKLSTMLSKQMKRKTKQATEEYVYSGSGDTGSIYLGG